MEDEHVMEAVGKTRVVVRNGVVTEIGEPYIEECPLAKKFSKPVLVFNPDSVRANMESRIREVGMFTKDRKLLSDEDFVPFGASELLATGLRSRLIDAAVITSDGAGTVIATNPSLVQGIGGRMSGLVKTSPIKEVMEGIEANGGHILDHVTASIDQVRGAAMARGLGYKRVAVTVTSPEDARKIREADKDALIIGVHLTGISKEGAELLVENSDIVSACASRWVREIASSVALLQAGISIPVFALSCRGKALLAEKVKETQFRLLIKIEKLPVTGGKEPRPLV